MSFLKKALIAMSGGVDSSVAAKIIQDKGYECIGATMKLFSCVKSNSSDIDDARAVAEKLNMEYFVFNFEDKFKEKVIDKFIKTYSEGGTPNPCIDCNKYLKFGGLFAKAKELDCDLIVTGHYADIRKINGRFCLCKAADLKKDQSYVLYNLTKDMLEHIAFPLGSCSKEEARKIALENGFVNASKKESQDICFVPDGDYAAFIENYSGLKFPEGDFVDESGNILGRHKGIIRYTIGQRKGLGLALPTPMYVKSKDPKNNTVTLCLNDDLFTDTVHVKDFNWVSIDNPHSSIRAAAKIRYNMTEAPCTVTPNDENGVVIKFDSPQRAVTKGQSAVVYDGDIVLGGGIIV